MTLSLYGYYFTTYTLTHEPESNHLIIQTPLALYYVSADDNKQLWKYTIATGTDEQLDIDPSDTSGDNKSRDHNIHRLRYDGTYIWGVDCNNDGTDDDFDVWKLAVADDTVTEVGTSTGANADSVIVFDLFLFDGNPVVFNYELREVAYPDGYLCFWQVDSAPFTEVDAFGPITMSAIDVSVNSPGIVYNSWYYFLWWNQTDNNVVFGKVDLDGNFTPLAEESNTDFTDNPSQYGISYDDDDLFYCVLYDRTEAANYLYSWSVSGEPINWTQIGENNIAMQLDRNCTGSTYPFNLEKGFSIDEMKVFQLNLIKSHLNNIAGLEQSRPQTTCSIIAITDNYLIIDNDGTTEVWEYKDMISYITKIDAPVHPIFYEGGVPLFNLFALYPLSQSFDRDVKIEVLGDLNSANNSGDLKYLGSPNDINDQEVGDEYPDIDLIDDATLYDGELIIVETFDEHTKVLRLKGDATPGEDPTFTISITQTKANTWEIYVGGSDVGASIIDIVFYEDSTKIIELRINNDDIEDYYDAGWNKVEDILDDTLYHLKVVVRNDDTHDVYCEETLKIDDENTANGMTDGINKLVVTMSNDTTNYAYFDAWGDIQESDYWEGKNLMKIKENAVIMEGVIYDYSLKNVPDQKFLLRNPAWYELTKISPNITDYTNYTGKTSGQIITQLISDFCNYITVGSISNGSTTWTCPDDWKAEGDNNLLEIINKFAEQEVFVARIRPQGELDFDDATLDTHVSINSTHNMENIKAHPISENINYVKVWGGYVDGVQIGPKEANNLASQRKYGIVPWYKTIASILNETALQTYATNKLTLLSQAPLVLDFKLNLTDIGFIISGETMYIESGIKITDSNMYITAGIYIIMKVRFDIKNNILDLTLSDGLLGKTGSWIEDPLKTLPSENNQLIKQIMGTGYATSEHNRELVVLRPIPESGDTAGANNVYWASGYITFGTTSVGNAHAIARVQLPDDYVDGEDITLRISYIINQVSATIDYDIEGKYGNESTDLTQTNNPTGQFTSNATANRPNHEDITITGTNLSAGDDLVLEIAMDDNSATDVIQLLSLKLLIPVETRT